MTRHAVPGRSVCFPCPDTSIVSEIGETTLSCKFRPAHARLQDRAGDRADIDQCRLHLRLDAIETRWISGGRRGNSRWRRRPPQLVHPRAGKRREGAVRPAIKTSLEIGSLL